MANGDGHLENTAKTVENKNDPSDALFADSHPKMAVEKVASAPDAPVAPTEKFDNTANANDKAGDKGVAKLEQAVTANLPESSKAKIDSLCSTPEGSKLLSQDHACGQSVMKQLETLYPLAYNHAGLDKIYKN